MTTSTNSKKTASSTAKKSAAAIACQSGKDSKSLPAGKVFEMKFNGAVVTGSTHGELIANIFILAGSIDRLGFYGPIASAIINGLPEQVVTQSKQFVKDIGSPKIDGKTLNTQTKGGVGRRLSRTVACLNGLRAIVNPWVALEHVTDATIGAEILASAVESAGMMFDTAKSVFVEDPENQLIIDRKAAQAAKEKADGTEGDAPSDDANEATDASDAAQVLSEAATVALNASDLIAMLANSYVVTTGKPLSYDELKQVAADNDRVVADFIKTLTDSIAA
jgi:hypothetical protein